MTTGSIMVMVPDDYNWNLGYLVRQPQNTCSIFDFRFSISANLLSFSHFVFAWRVRLNTPFPSLIAMNSDAKTREMMAWSFITILIAGPEVSLSGSPTVSPMTAALWTYMTDV